MRVIIDFEFEDAEREQIVKYYRKTEDLKGLPKLATRVLLRQFVEDALNRHRILVDETLVD